MKTTAATVWIVEVFSTVNNNSLGYWYESDETISRNGNPELFYDSDSAKKEAERATNIAERKGWEASFKVIEMDVEIDE